MTSSTSVEQRLARLEAVQQIQNLMGRYSFLHSANMHRECVDLFAMKTPDVRAEMMWGVYEGPEGIERCYPGFHVWADGDPAGKMHMHTLTTPVIEVAADGRTARGVWVSPGHETGPDFHNPTSKHMKANWAWCKYGCDFILEDGVWKIWHLHVFGIFMTPYDKSWAEDAKDMNFDDMPPLPEEFAPDRKPTTHWNYLPDLVYVNEPAPPEPYESFGEDIVPGAF
ncbi:nuclear transport factor 2 family protein [Streptomyces sp. NBC_00988]|uniref:nuclear transport factor 2 family protein n=1 Tax=Streptomyces sp. NBC_00988 TaxID=2903704 RepID=UPI00386F4C1A|nr:nuclear transport factor 2 family protein [Streptomyces sp. NBC_00988]